MSKSYSIILQSKIPSFIRDDESYSVFLDFIEEYYSWFNDAYQLMDFEEAIDVDAGFKSFEQYFKADFLPNFPSEIAADTTKLIKLVKQLYKSKGIPDSFKFLFRALYNSSCQVLPSEDFILKASDGKWIVPKYIKIKSLDTTFSKLSGLKILGETSKATGIVTSSSISGNYTKLYLSDIQKSFISGETIRVIDFYNRDAYFVNGVYTDYVSLTPTEFNSQYGDINYTSTPPANSSILQSKIIGSISNITIDPNNKGAGYSIGDPVIVYGGISGISSNTATANVADVSTGSILSVSVLNGGYGYSVSPNTIIKVYSSGVLDTVASCSVAAIDPTKPVAIANLSITIIGSAANNILGNSTFTGFSATGNANSSISSLLSFTTINTYPISAVIVSNPSSNFLSTPVLDTISLLSDSSGNNSIQLRDLGILAPIQINSGGTNYTNSDTIIISSTYGYGAKARLSVNAIGTITSVTYYTSNTSLTPLGGIGYSIANLPTITVSTATGSGANLSVPTILGAGVQYSIATQDIGQINSINIINSGEDYANSPNVSLRVQDLAVTNVSSLQIDQYSIAYQGSIGSPTFYGKIDSSQKIVSTSNFLTDVYRLRLYNFTGSVSTNPLIIYNTKTNSVIANLIFNNSYNTGNFVNGSKIYGNGFAKATAKFSSAINLDEGRYLNQDGQLSSYNVLQSEDYNYKTYFVESEVEYDNYKNTIKTLVHPSGTKMIPRFLIKSNTSSTIANTSNVNIANTTNVTLRLFNMGTYYSNNFSIVSGTASQIKANSYIAVTSNNNMNVFSKVVSVNTITSNVYIDSKVITTFANTMLGISNANTIILTSDASGAAFTNDNKFFSVGDTISNGVDSVPVIRIQNNTLYFTNTLSKQTFPNSSYISITKSLTSSNVTIYSTV